jgi:hypothetical protein
LVSSTKSLDAAAFAAFLVAIEKYLRRSFAVISVF